MEYKMTDLSVYDNSWYKTGGSSFKRGLWYFVNTVFFKSAFPFSLIKIIILKIFGTNVGRGVVVKPHVNIKYPWNLSLGNHTWIGEGVWIDNLVKVTIGEHVCISQGAMLLTGSHDYSKTTFDLRTEEILVEAGVWIGAKAMVCPGVNCKSHSVLTAGSVATKNMDPYAVYQGNPAIRIRDRIIS